MMNARAGLPERSKRAATARKAALLAAIRHVTPVAIRDPREQFEDYDDDELWDLADEAADDELYKAAHDEIVRRKIERRRRRRFGGPVRMILAFLLIAFLIVGPIVALWLYE